MSPPVRDGSGFGGAHDADHVHAPWPYRLREGTDDMTDMASNGTPMDKLTEEDWESPYGLGKFDTIAEEKLYAWTMSTGHNDETGGGEFPWSCRFNQDTDEGYRIPALREGVILTVSTRGGVSSERFDTAEELEAAWKDCEDTYAQWLHSECEDGVNCDGCEYCES